MTIMTRILAGGVGLAALATVTPAAAQYGYGYGANTQFATQRCAAAVQSRLNRPSGILGIFGANSGGRVLSVTQVQPRRNMVRVRGLATSGRYASGPYGAGAYGALGYNYAQPADLSFRCDVDFRGRVRDVDINRRR